MNAIVRNVVGQFAPGTPMPEHDWTWRRIFSYVFAVSAIACQVLALWMMYQLIHLVTFYVTQAAGETTWMSTKLQSAVQIANTIIPPAMETFKWYVILQSITGMLVMTYYLIAPSAETLKGMTVAIAAIRAGTPVAQVVQTNENPDGTKQTQEVNTSGTPAPQVSVPPLPPAGTVAG